MAERAKTGSDEHYYRVLGSIAKRFSRDTFNDDHMDMMHDAYVNCLARHPQDGPWFTARYLKINVEGEIMQARRKRLRREAITNGTPASFDADEAMFRTSPARHHTDLEAIASIELAGIFAAAEDDENIAILLRYTLGDDDRKTMGDRWGISPSGVRDRVEKARKSLKEMGYA